MARITVTSEREGMLRLYHGGNVSTVDDSGMFGGIFASPSRGAAASHGDLHYFDVDERAIAENFDLDSEKTEGILRRELGEFNESEYDAIDEIVIRDKGVWDSELDEQRLLDIFRSTELGEAGWEAQRVRGVVARELGFQAVKMQDEHGVSYLVLPGAVALRID